MATSMRTVVLLSRSFAKPLELQRRHFHKVHLIRGTGWGKLHLLSKHTNRLVPMSVACVRHASTTEVPVPPPSLPAGYIPDVPTLPMKDTIQLPDLNALGEPTLQSLDLGGNSPIGLAQQLMEYMHVSLELPWWGALTCVAVGIRIIMVPMMVYQRKFMTRYMEHMPNVMKYKSKQMEARLEGNQLEVMYLNRQLKDYQKRNGVQMRNLLLGPVFQIPLFLSMFIGIRRMVEAPVESMKMGGLSWFMDLTVADPYYLLPLITGASLIAVIELGTDTMRAKDMGKYGKWFIRGMPLVSMVFMSTFPSALVWYWTCSNMLGVLIAQILKNERVKAALKIPNQKKMPETAKMDPMKMWKNHKALKKYEEREKVEASAFRTAGIGPIPKTYAYDPTTRRERMSN